MAYLTSRILASAVTGNDLIHIVVTGDTSQGNPSGSSYKATLNQLTNIFAFTGGNVLGNTNFLSGVTANTLTTSALSINGLVYTGITEDITVKDSGVTIHFSAKTVFNGPTLPSSSSAITENLTNARIGVVQKIYHSGATPTFPATWQLIGEGDYYPNELNIIYAEYVETNWTEYWVVQKQS